MCFHFRLWYCVGSKTEAWKISVVPCLRCWFLAIANGHRNRITPNNSTHAKKQWPCTRTKWFICALVWTIFLTDVQRQCFFYWPLLLFMLCVCHAVLSVLCSLVVTCLERVGRLAFLSVMLSCVIVTFLCGVLGRVWYLIASIPDICLILNYIYHELASIKNCLFFWMLFTKRRYSNQHNCYI